MKRFIPLLIIALLTLVIAEAIRAQQTQGTPTLTTPRSIRLEWDYPTNNLGTDCSFIVYGSTNVTTLLNTWPVITNVVGTNLSVRLTLAPATYFFAVAHSNLWGVSAFSRVVQSPAPPLDDIPLRIVGDR